MGRVLISKAGRKDPKASDVLASYHPEEDGLTYYYWDDWALSGLLKPGGLTLTLGLAGGSGPRRLAKTDPEHRQVGVDLDVSKFCRQSWDMKAVAADAFAFASGCDERFDTIWVDLYGPHGLLPGVLDSAFLLDLKRLLAPGGILFIHLFRPQNRFYRFNRLSDPFEPAFAALAESAGLRASIFDHYASQTWVMCDMSAAELGTLLTDRTRSHGGPLQTWTDGYMLEVLRTPLSSYPRPEHARLVEAFLAAPAPSALEACGLSPAAAEFDAWSQNPTLPAGAPGSVRETLELETLAAWTTAPGVTLPPFLRVHLRETCERRVGISPEVGLRFATGKI